MKSFPSARAVEAALRLNLVSKGHTKAFVNVQQVPSEKGDPIYIITTESSLASLLEPFLETRIGRRCPYSEGSFLVHGAEAENLVG